MYFIPRNNRVYNYIAHTQQKKRYLCTAFFLVILIALSYCVYHVCLIYSELYVQEIAALRKQYADMQRIERKNSALTHVIDEVEKEMQSALLAAHDDSLKQQLLFLLDAVRTSGLQLNAYNIQKEKKYDWYSKETAHLDVRGSLQQIMNFCESIKNSQRMMIIEQWSVAQVDAKTFTVHCDVECIVLLP